VIFPMWKGSMPSFGFLFPRTPLSNFPDNPTKLPPSPKELSGKQAFFFLFPRCGMQKGSFSFPEIVRPFFFRRFVFSPPMAAGRNGIGLCQK